MDLDLRTVALLTTTLNGLMFGALAVVMRDVPREAQPELRHWTLGLGLLALGWLLAAGVPAP